MLLSDLPALPGVRHRDVDAGGVRLHVAEDETGRLRLRVGLIHGPQRRAAAGVHV